MKNFVLPRDDDLSAKPGAGKLLSSCFLFAASVRLNKLMLRLLVGELSNLGVGPEKKRRSPTTSVAPMKSDAEKAQPSKVKNVGGEKKAMRRSSDSWCDYVLVSDSLEGLEPVVIRRPKPEPKDTADIPPSNPDDPIDLKSSPERLVRKKAGKRKQTNAGAEGRMRRRFKGRKLPGGATWTPSFQDLFLVRVIFILPF
ncbi:hypothetical protein Hanom_Chr12g01145101 [Helianthus anomalus]